MVSFILTRKNKKAQAWGMDLIIAMVIFSLGIIIFLIYSLSYSNNLKDDYEMLFYEGKLLSETILSEGYPSDWNSTHVLRIGILTENKINQSKLEDFYSLSQNNYTLTKRLLNIRYDYYFLIDGNFTMGSEKIRGFGKPEEDFTNISAKNLISIKRVTIYENKPVTVYVYIWEK